MKLFVNEVQIEGNGLDFKVAPEDRIEVLAAIAGG